MHHFFYFMFSRSLCAYMHLHRQTVILMLFNVYCKYVRIQSKAILCAHENGQTSRIEGEKREQMCASERKTKSEKQQQ